MKYLRSFARFWWNFIVGDDWRVAVGVAAALGLTALLVHEGVHAWWLLPPAIALVLAGSLWRATGGGAGTTAFTQPIGTRTDAVRGHASDGFSN